jgi:RsmE family RNA methyltransferase
VGAERHIAALEPLPREAVAVVIGPEGGLSADELGLLIRRGARTVHLGARVLRSRLAGTIAVALLRAGVERAEVSPAALP